MIKVSRMNVQKFVVELKGKMHNAFKAKNKFKIRLTSIPASLVANK